MISDLQSKPNLMSASDEGLQRRLILIIAGLPFIIALFTIGGVLLGFYLSGLTGDPQSILLPFILSTAGLAASIIISYNIAKRVTGTAERGAFR